jgi:hypothetical protein
MALTSHGDAALLWVSFGTSLGGKTWRGETVSMRRDLNVYEWATFRLPDLLSGTDIDKYHADSAGLVRDVRVSRVEAVKLLAAEEVPDNGIGISLSLEVTAVFSGRVFRSQVQNLDQAIWRVVTDEQHLRDVEVSTSPRVQVGVQVSVSPNGEVYDERVTGFDLAGGWVSW